MHRGFVKLWRKSLDGGLIKNHKVFIFWVWCLLKTNHQKDYKQTVGYQEIILQPGEFVFGLKSASDEIGLSVQNIRTCLNFLKKSKNLTIKTTNKFSIVSIINWGIYQPDCDKPNNQTNTCLTSIQQASNNKQEYKNKENNNTPLVPPRGKSEKIFSGLNNYLSQTLPEKLSQSKSEILDFYEYRMKTAAKKYKTTAGIDGLFRDLLDCQMAGYDPGMCCKIAKQNDWLTPRTLYFEKAGLISAVKQKSNITPTRQLTDEEQKAEFLS